MARTTPINVGTVANDGTGDALRVAMQTVNTNMLDTVSQSDTTAQALASDVDFATGKGVSFDGGDVLGDYEEGTWSPTFQNIGTGAYDRNTGSYTKIGDTVSCDFVIELSSMGTASGNIVIESLPFLPRSTDARAVCSVLGADFSVSKTGLIGFSGNGVSNIVINTGSGSTSALSILQHSDLGTGLLRVSITYKTSA
jgi:hypothetical protein